MKNSIQPLPMSQTHLLKQVGRLSLSADSLDKPNFVFVKLDGESDQAPHTEASIQIPAAVWDDVRKEPAVLYDLADLSDADLRRMARRQSEQWNSIKGMFRPHAAAYRAILEFARAYNVPISATDKVFYRDLCKHRSAQQNLRKTLGLLRDRRGKKSIPET